MKQYSSRKLSLSDGQQSRYQNLLHVCFNEKHTKVQYLFVFKCIQQQNPRVLIIDENVKCLLFSKTDKKGSKKNSKVMMDVQRCLFGHYALLLFYQYFNVRGKMSNLSNFKLYFTNSILSISVISDHFLLTGWYNKYTGLPHRNTKVIGSHEKNQKHFECSY